MSVPEVLQRSAAVLALRHHLLRHMTQSSRPALLALFAAIIFTPCLQAQDNYEIQVYGSDTVPPRSTMVEIHSNFTGKGSTTVQDGLLATNHAEHETLELTQGINDWAEVGFYVFSSLQSDYGWQWVGDHIRPRVRAPEKWHWPVGVSLSMESDTNAPPSHPTHGRGRFVPSSTEKSAPGILP